MDRCFLINSSILPYYSRYGYSFPLRNYSIQLLLKDIQINSTLMINIYYPNTQYSLSSSTVTTIHNVLYHLYLNNSPYKYNGCWIKYEIFLLSQNQDVNIKNYQFLSLTIHWNTQYSHLIVKPGNVTIYNIIYITPPLIYFIPQLQIKIKRHQTTKNITP